MTDRSFPDFLNSIEWNLVARNSYLAPVTSTPYLNRLPNRQFLIQNSHVLIVGINSEGARSSWNTGAWANQVIPFLPSSTSAFTAAVQHESKRLRLRILNLVVYPKLVSDWILDLSFPYWLPDVSVEIWRYDGRDVDQFQRFNDLEGLII